MSRDDFGDLGIEGSNVDDFAGVFLLNIAGHSDVVAVGGNLTVIYQPGEVVAVLARSEGIENFSLVGGGELVLVAAASELGTCIDE